MSATTDVDIYDGHLLLTERGGDDLAHEVIHPPTCAPVERWEGFIEHACAVAFVVDGMGDECWQDATTPGYRIIGWRHETYRCGFSTEHDVVCWALPDLLCAASVGVSNRQPTNQEAE